MEIIINHVNNKKEVYNETNAVMYSYKKLINNPHKKIIKTNIKLAIFLTYILLFLIFIIYICSIRRNPLYYICLGIGVLGFLVVLKSTILFYKNRKINCSKETNSILKIDDEKIELNNKVVNIVYSVNWSDVKQVLITKNCILFMPYFEKINKSVFISIPREYEKDILTILDKYNKKELVQYN